MLSKRKNCNIAWNGGENGKNSKKHKVTTRDRVLIWNEFYSSNTFGIWIECTKCSKWRKVSQYSDSYEVPQDWHCSMSESGKGHKMCCDDSEEKCDEDFFEYSPGSVVWAKLDGYPWWPGMIDEDPDVEEYFWRNSRGYTFYNVTFLDDHVTHAWIASSQISLFSNPPKKNSVLLRKYSILIFKAEEKARRAIKMNVKERLQTFSFVHLYKGKWGLAAAYDEINDYQDTEDLDITDILLKEVDEISSLDSYDLDYADFNDFMDSNKDELTSTQKKRILVEEQGEMNKIKKFNPLKKKGSSFQTSKKFPFAASNKKRHFVTNSGKKSEVLKPIKKPVEKVGMKINAEIDSLTQENGIGENLENIGHGISRSSLSPNMKDTDKVLMWIGKTQNTCSDSRNNISSDYDSPSMLNISKCFPNSEAKVEIFPNCEDVTKESGKQDSIDEIFNVICGEGKGNNSQKTSKENVATGEIKKLDSRDTKKQDGLEWIFDYICAQSIDCAENEQIIEADISKKSIEVIKPNKTPKLTTDLKNAKKSTMLNNVRPVERGKNFIMSVTSKKVGRVLNTEAATQDKKMVHKVRPKIAKKNEMALDKQKTTDRNISKTKISDSSLKIKPVFKPFKQPMKEKALQCGDEAEKQPCNTTPELIEEKLTTIQVLTEISSSETKKDKEVSAVSSVSPAIVNDSTNEYINYSQATMKDEKKVDVTKMKSKANQDIAETVKHAHLNELTSKPSDHESSSKSNNADDGFFDINLSDDDLFTDN